MQRATPPQSTQYATLRLLRSKRSSLQENNCGFRTPHCRFRIRLQFGCVHDAAIDDRLFAPAPTSESS